MKKLLFGLVATALFVGCGAGEDLEVRQLVEEHPPVGSVSAEMDSRPHPTTCVLTCSQKSEYPPPGQVCTLESEECYNGIRFCYYNCRAIEANPN